MKIDTRKLAHRSVSSIIAGVLAGGVIVLSCVLYLVLHHFGLPLQINVGAVIAFILLAGFFLTRIHKSSVSFAYARVLRRLRK